VSKRIKSQNQFNDNIIRTNKTEIFITSTEKEILSIEKNMDSILDNEYEKTLSDNIIYSKQLPTDTGYSYWKMIIAVLVCLIVFQWRQNQSLFNQIRKINIEMERNHNSYLVQFKESKAAIQNLQNKVSNLNK
jgi:hypothetical protein